MDKNLKISIALSAVGLIFSFAAVPFYNKACAAELKKIGY